MYIYLYVTLKSFAVYFRSHLQPFLYFTDDNNFESKIFLVDHVGTVSNTNKISPSLFPFDIFEEEDGSGGDSLHGDCSK